MPTLSIPGLGYRRRLLLVFSFAALFFGVLLARLGYLQFVRGEELRARAMEVRLHDIPIDAKRGLIVDRNFRPLAVSINADSVYAKPAQVRDGAAKLGIPVAEVARTLATTLNLDYDRVLNRITQETAFVYIKRKVSPEEGKAIRDLVRARRLPGVDLTQEGKRVYTKERIAAHVIGIAGIDSQGLEGIEKVYDEQLRGQDGRIQVEVDARGRTISNAAQAYVPPRDGNTLVLTIDETVQHICTRGVEEAMAKTQARQAAIIAMDPHSGEILCMAMLPDYDPNRYQDYPARNRRPWVVADTLEPGSMFKPVVAAAAMEEGLIDRNTPFAAPACIQMAGYNICNWNHAPVSGTLLDIVAQSSNTGFMQIGLRLGIPKFYEYIERFGLLERTGIDLPGEAVGQFKRREQAQQLDLAVMSFGQSFTASPLQVLRAIAAIANDGRLVRPHLVREIRTPDGSRVIWRAASESPRQVVSPKTARELSDMLEQVVSRGTGTNAYVPGYKVAGKTGTAEKLPRGSGKYTGNFVGFAPSDDPRIAVVVVIDEPQGVYYGGQIAAPVFRDIMGDLLRYLEIPPELPLSSRPRQQTPPPPERLEPVPALINLVPAEAQRVAREAGFDLVFEVAGGPVVTRQLPPPGTVVKRGTAIEVSTELPPAGTSPPRGSGAFGDAEVTVPDLRGKTIREAGELLAQRDLLLQPVSTGVAVRQDPAPGARVRPGTAITVEFQPPR